MPRECPDSARNRAGAGFEPVAVITCADMPKPDSDGALLMQALGEPVELLSWDADVDWSRFGRVVLRSPWDYHTRLPALPGREAGSMAQAFNRMAQSIEDNMNARQEALEARSHLEDNRELTQFIQSRIEEERRDIARELHDELGQAVTAIKSMGLSIVRRDDRTDARSAEAARLIVDTADHLYDVMHSIIPRLRPLALDNLGLADALEDLVAGWQRHHPEMHFELSMTGLPDAPGDSLKLAAYRIVQEAVTNALTHAGAQKIVISLHGSEQWLDLAVEDDGAGLAEGWAQKRGHHGVRGMRERAQALGGEVELAAREGGGTRVAARLPLE